MSRKSHLKAMKRTASLLLRAKSYRVSPISEEESKNPNKMADFQIRKGFIEGLGTALAIMVQELKDE